MVLESGENKQLITTGKEGLDPIHSLTLNELPCHLGKQSGHAVPLKELI